MSTFEPIEPYNVDMSNRMVYGRILNAASRGDRRAKLTLDEYRRQQPPPPPAEPKHGGSVAAGRALFHGGMGDMGGDAA